MDLQTARASQGECQMKCEQKLCNVGTHKPNITKAHENKATKVLPRIGESPTVQVCGRKMRRRWATAWIGMRSKGWRGGAVA